MTSSLLLMAVLASLSLTGGLGSSCPEPSDAVASGAGGSPRPGLAQEPVASGKSSDALVQVNLAGVRELCTLPGIGPARAQAILQARERRPFTRLSDLGRVKGLGAKRLKQLAGRVGFEPAARAGVQTAGKGGAP